MEHSTEILQLLQYLKRSYDIAMAPVARIHKLTRNELDVLLFLYHNPTYNTARDIVELRGLTKSHVCKSVLHLSQLGLLTACRDKHDHRIQRLELHHSSDSALADAVAAQEQFFRQLDRGITSGDKKRLEQIRLKLMKNLCHTVMAE